MAAIPATPVVNFAFLPADLYKSLHVIRYHWLSDFSAGTIMYQSMCRSASYIGVWASVHSCGKLCLDGPDNDCGGHLPDIC